MTVRGLDVASYQAEHFPLDGADFVFVKATEGTSYVNPKQRRQAGWARSSGAVVGWYHFLRPGSMTAQAAYFVEKCGSIPGDPLWADWEDNGVSCADKDAFLREVKRLRGDTHRVGLYCNTNFWLHHDTTSYAADALWIAHYGVRAGHPGIRHPWLFHQYTSDPVDQSVGQFPSREALRGWANKDGGHEHQEEQIVSISDKDAARIAEATDGEVMTWDGVTPPHPTKDNPHWTTVHALEDIWKRIDRIETKLDALDPGALGAELRSAVGRIKFEVTAS